MNRVTKRDRCFALFWYKNEWDAKKAVKKLNVMNGREENFGGNVY